ncbi:MAG: exodeoxyribonuclease VII large subunit [Nitrosomonas sp.]|jgi:exodeoxyribonuclease VII large subunit|nr:exodeoxyribonuclease VII large subunit [Nitrosomonas sp.]
MPEIQHSIITVSELNRNVKTVLESNIPLLWIRGEISNIKCYPSGHWYFSLKDADAQVRCVMFRHKNQFIDWNPKDGAQVEALALVTLYEARGDYQLNIETLRRAGLGALFEAFEQLKNKLEKAGLFDPAQKRNLPSFPKQVGIITSPATAALRDVLTTLKRRMPMLPVIIYPTPVQGKDAALHIAAAITSASGRQECDILILCRGGGSIEDLWSFNEEIVAQAIAACAIPVVCGIGHETDFTIADFIADKRAPTPTGAAELVSISMEEWIRQLKRLQQNMQRAALRGIENRMQQIDLLAHRLTHPGERINHQLAHLCHLQKRLTHHWNHHIARKQWKITELKQRLLRILQSRADLLHSTGQIEQLSTRLQQAVRRCYETQSTRLLHHQIRLANLNPQAVLERGYSITYSAHGEIIRSANQLHKNDKIQVKFAQGRIDAQIQNINKN